MGRGRREDAVKFHRLESNPAVTFPYDLGDEGSNSVDIFNWVIFKEEREREIYK